MLMVTQQRHGSQAGSTLGSPVVPEVYMMVQMSDRLQSTAGTGEAAPKAMNASKVCTLTPWLLRACMHKQGS